MIPGGQNSNVTGINFFIHPQRTTLLLFICKRYSWTSLVLFKSVICSMNCEQ